MTGTDQPTAGAGGLLAEDVFARTPEVAARSVPPSAGEGADAYLSRLIDGSHYEDAVRFTAAGLDARSAVWWGALAVWNVQRKAAPTTGRDAATAIDAAVAWVLEPNEANRRAANAAGERAGVKTAPGALATGAFWAEGSISLPGQPEVPPPAGVCQTFVANAVLMAHAGGQPLLAALRLGAEVHAGANRWPEAQPATKGAVS